MTQEEFSKKILDKIDQDKITPKPKWTFLLKDYVLWFSGILSLVIGSLATAIIIFMLVNNNLDLVKYSTQSLSKYILLSIPYVWIIFLAIFIASTYLNLKNTKKGYRYALTTIILSTIFLSIFLGTIFYGLGLGHTIDKVLTKNIPPYQRLVLQKEKGFNQPDGGLLSGIITSIGEEHYCQIEDPTGKIWAITSKDNFPFPKEILEEGDKVRIIGKIIDEDIFEACVIRPHSMRGQGIMPHKMSPDERNILRMRTIECGGDKVPPMHRTKMFYKN